MAWFLKSCRAAFWYNKSWHKSKKKLEDSDLVIKSK